MKKLLLILILVSSPVFAVKEYYSINRSYRALGMGGAFYGLSDDESALFYNPAGLALIRNEWQFVFPIQIEASQNALSNGSTIKDAVDGANDVGQVVSLLSNIQGKPTTAGFSIFPHFVKNFGIGLLLGGAKVNFSVLGAGFDTELEATAIADNGLLVGYAHSFGAKKNLHLGLTLKALARAGGRQSYDVIEIAQDVNLASNLEDLGGAGGGIDADVGAIYELPEFKALPFLLESRVGFSVNNVVGSKFPLGKTGAPPPLARHMSFGTAAILKGWNFIDNFIVAVDFAEIALGGGIDADLGARHGSLWKHLNLGVEMPMNRWFAFRTGFHQGLFTAGFGLNAKYFKMDFAWYGEEMARNVGRLNNRRLALRLTFGGGDWYPAPVKYTRSEAIKRRKLLEQKRLEEKKQKDSEAAQKVKEAKAAEEKAKEPVKEEPKPEASSETPSKESPKDEKSTETQ